MIYKFESNPYDIVFDYLYNEYKDKINDNTIIYFGLGIDILSFINKFDNYKKIIVSINNIDKNILNEINKKNIDIVLTPSNLKIEDSVLMAEDMAFEINDSILINLFKEKKAVKAYFNYAKNLNLDYKNIVLDLYFGIFTGIAKYAKMKNEDIRVIGIKRIDYESDILDTDYFDEITKSIDIDDNDDNLIITI